MRSGKRLVRIYDHLLGSVGSEPVAIAPLVSPLRYDVLVRAEFFDAVEAAPDPDAPEFVAAAAASDYGTWFRVVAIPRFRPELVGDVPGVEAAFAARVRAAVTLWRNFCVDGFDRHHPVTLRRPAPGATSTSGRPVDRELYLTDGCHRLALLLRSGHTALGPGEYRIGRRRLALLRDNTAALVPLLAPGRDRLAAFEALAGG
jgi:hypothetical protein